MRIRVRAPDPHIKPDAVCTSVIPACPWGDGKWGQEDPQKLMNQPVWYVLWQTRDCLKHGRIWGSKPKVDSA